MKKILIMITLILLSINVFSQEKRVHFMNYPLEGKTSDFIDYLSSKDIIKTGLYYEGKLLDRKVELRISIAGLKKYVDLIKLTIYTNDYKYDAEVITNYFTEKYGNPTITDGIISIYYKWNLENGYIEITHDNIVTSTVSVKYFNSESYKMNKELEEEYRKQYIEKNRIVVE